MQTSKRITALLLAPIMCLSLLTTNVWATDETDTPDASVSTTEEEPVQPTIKLNKTSLTLDVKKTKTLKATVEGASDQVTWKSSNKKIATVDKNGRVTAKKEGKCTITATANGVSAKCRVEVSSPKARVLAEFEQYLSILPSKAKFTLIYVDKDKIPELFIEIDDWETVHEVFYYKGQVYYDGELSPDYGRTCDEKQTLLYYKGTGVYAFKGPDGVSYYKMSKGSFGWSMQSYYDIGEEGWRYENAKGKKVSKSKFNKLVKKKTGSTKAKKAKFYKNTKSNRKKYLK